MLKRLIARIKGWIVEDGPAHNHSEGDWRPDCPAIRCQAITQDWIRRNAR